MNTPGLPSRIRAGSAWAIFTEVLVGAIRALSYLVYARLLVPADFGLIGFCLLLISLFPMLIDNTLGLALIRHPHEDQRAFSTIYFLNIGLSGLATFLLWAAAPWFVSVIHDSRVALLLRVMTIQVFANSLCSVHFALARRHFEYNRIAPVRVIATICSIGVGVPLAVLSRSYWALAAGSVTAALAQMVAAWVLLPWRPSISFDSNLVKSLAPFASWVAMDMGITWMVMSGGGFFLAFYLGAHDLGLFRLSDQIDTFVLGALLSPLIPVLYSAFCEVSTDRHQWWPLFQRTVRLVSLVALSAGATIAILALPLQSMAGIKWHGIASVILLNAIADGISYASLPGPSLLRAQGKARVVAIIRFFMVLGQIIVYFLIARYGLIPFLLGKLGLEGFMYALTYVGLRWNLGIPVLKLVGIQAGQATAIATCAAVAIVAANMTISLGPATAATLALLAFAIPLGAYLLVAERHSIRWLLERS